MATNQTLVLETISMEYHAFRKDQLLTDTQLNELISYFEDQDRITRTCLVGVGLVCGLGITYDSSKPSITVGKGCGVTTDGDLLVVDATTYLNFRKYDNRKKGTNDPIYDPFFPATDGGNQIGLWELVIPDSKGVLPTDAKLLSSFNSATGKVLDDMVALLYLEYYLQDPDKCTAIDCDNQGPKQVSQIKVLLLSKVDMEKVINRDPASEVIADSIYTKYHNSSVQYFNLPSLKARRVILNATNTSSIALLAKSYTGIVHADAGKLIKAIADLYTGFRFMIDADSKVNINLLKQDLQKALALNPKVYLAQYLYDFYKDLLCAYNELRNLLFRSMSECCPDKYAFPKHIMLGEIKASGTIPAPYRHDFYPSPAVSGARERIAQCCSMWQRLVQMCTQFSIPDQPATVKVTPSANYDRMLEDRAVPFYFKDVKAMVGNWNYGLGVRNASAQVLSYHAPQYAGGMDSTINPLDYDIDRNDFFRIEGHLGKVYNEALADISKIRDDKSIPFDLVAIRLNKTGNLSDININDFDCQFDDLNALLRSWLIDQNCLYSSLTSFFTGFSTNKTVGFHTQLDEYKAVTPPVYLAREVIANEMKISGIRMLATAKTGTNLSTGTTMTSSAPAGTTSSQPFCKTIYFVDKTVTGSLSTNANSLGLQFAQTLKQPGLSADDIIADVKSRTANDTNLSALTAEEREVVYEVPITIVGHVSELSQMKPVTVDEINTTLLEKYMQRMELLCAYVKKLRGRMEGIFSSPTYARSGFESYYLILIGEMIANCCAVEVLESLLSEINRRKQKILDGLLLSNYAVQHPGLEHKAGVPRGGTFVLVYAQQVAAQRIATNLNTAGLLEMAVNTDRVLSDTSETVYTVSKSNASVYADVASFAYYLVTNQGKVNFDQEVAKYEKIHQIKDGSLEEQVFQKQLIAAIKEVCARLTKEEEATVAANVVVADFALPYLCCSDCPPMVFITPRPAYSLGLPKSSACSDEAMLQFRKDPADGVVKAPAGLESTIVNKDIDTFFDPSKVPDSFIGKAITFTIDDQVTDCSITVVKHPVAKFDFKIDKEADDSLSVIFSNTSDDATSKAYVYEWDFGDGRATQKVDNKNAISIVYNKATLASLGLDGKIPVKLTATNGPCSDVYTASVPFQKVVPVALTLPKDVVCNDSGQLPFTVTPPNGTVASADEPASVVQVGGAYMFDPSKVVNFGKQISFTVNGKATNCKIMVYRHPVAAFDANATLIANAPAGNLLQVKFTNQSDPQNNQQLTYNWVFGDGTTKATIDTSPFQQVFNMDVLRSKGQTALAVTLTATNPGCSGTVTKTVAFPVAAPVCGDLVRTAVSTDMASLSSSDITKFLATIQTSPQFSAITAQLADTIKVFATAIAQSATLDQVATQGNILGMIKTQLDKIYADKFDKNVNDAVVTPQIQVLLKLALNLIKCTAVPDPKVLELLNSVLTGFSNATQQLKQMTPALNKGNVLIQFLTDYLNTMKITDANTITMVKKLVDLIKATYLP